MVGTKVEIVLRDGKYYTWNVTEEEVMLDPSNTPTLDGNNVFTGTLVLSGLPTADPSVEGAIWNNLGVLNISAG